MWQRQTIKITAIGLLILFAGCDRLVDSGPGNSDCELGSAAAKDGCAVAGGDFTIVFTPEPGTARLLFRTSGAITDEGYVMGVLSPLDEAGTLLQNWSGGRGLVGTQGVLVISFEGEVNDSGEAITGRFEIGEGCRGDYAALQGSGAFKVAFRNGTLTETFAGTLVH